MEFAYPLIVVRAPPSIPAQDFLRSLPCPGYRVFPTSLVVKQGWVAGITDSDEEDHFVPSWYPEYRSSALAVVAGHGMTQQTMCSKEVQEIYFEGAAIQQVILNVVHNSVIFGSRDNGHDVRGFERPLI